MDESLLPDCFSCRWIYFRFNQSRLISLGINRFFMLISRIPNEEIQNENVVIFYARFCVFVRVWSISYVSSTKYSHEEISYDHTENHSNITCADSWFWNLSNISKESIRSREFQRHQMLNGNWERIKMKKSLEK